MTALAGGRRAGADANLVTEAPERSKWDKARSGSGHRLQRHGGERGDRVITTHGDIKSEVNRGLNCVRDAFLAEIMYCHDRPTLAMLRKQRQYDKYGEFTPASWDEPSTSWRKRSRPR